MVRSAQGGVDLGLWKVITPDQLMIPCDVHVERTARALGLIYAKSTNWQMVVTLTERLRQFDPSDPVKYDYALFGMSRELALK
jgi:uncharacterized protein (TIGR02757 family)